jgi:hypothetical protein
MGGRNPVAGSGPVADARVFNKYELVRVTSLSENTSLSGHVQLM